MIGQISARCRSATSFEPASNLSATSFEPDSVMKFGLYCTDVAQCRSTKLCTMFCHLLDWYNILVYTFLGHLTPDGIMVGAKFTLRPSLVFSYIGSVAARYSSRGRQPNFAAWYKAWNYGTFAEGATCIRQGHTHILVDCELTRLSGSSIG